MIVGVRYEQLSTVTMETQAARFIQRGVRRDVTAGVITRLAAANHRRALLRVQINSLYL